LFFGSVAGDQAGCRAGPWRRHRQTRHAQSHQLKQCLATEVPAYVAFYRAAPGLSGADEFELEVSLGGGRKQREHFRVNISDSPGAGQGI
jgi:hypothetical protein